MKTPQINRVNNNNAYKKNRTLKKPNFYFLLGVLTASVIFIIILNLLIIKLNA